MKSDGGLKHMEYVYAIRVMEDSDYQELNLPRQYGTIADFLCRREHHARRDSPCRS